MTSPTPAPPAGVPLLAIDHVGLAVPDLDAAIAFHTGVLGGVLTHRETNADQGVEEAMISYDSGAQVQLLAPSGPASTIAKFLDRQGPGLQQLAYRVADVESVSQQLRDRGLRLLFDEPRRGTAGSRVNFVHPKDAGGVLVELVEDPPRRVTGPPVLSPGPGRMGHWHHDFWGLAAAASSVRRGATRVLARPGDRAPRATGIRPAHHHRRPRRHQSAAAGAGRSAGRRAG